jgi:LmbE family N-acetylglucosaminyl deacetylase
MKKHNLVVVAHPDDETIFFGGLLQAYRRKPWHVVCVTDGQGQKRQEDFLNACRKLKVARPEIWDFPDVYDQRFDIDRLAKRLGSLSPTEIFTHGILGEYGHPHHQDICVAVHRAFPQHPKIWSPAYNCYAEKLVRLSRKIYQTKCSVLSKVYLSETLRFARWLPAQNTEGFVRLSTKEVEILYRFLSSDDPELPVGLKVYSWFLPYLNEFRSQVTARPF